MPWGARGAHTAQRRDAGLRRAQRRGCADGARQEERWDLPECGGGEGQGASNVHGIAQDVEGEALDPMVHEDTKVVPEERTSYTQCPCRSDDEDLASDEEHGRDEGIKGLREHLLSGLLL